MKKKAEKEALFATKRAEILATLKQREEVVSQIYKNYIFSDSTLIGHVERVTACAFSPDRSSVISASADGSLILWDARTGSELRIMQGHKDKVTACAFSPDGASIVSASEDHTLIIWNARTGKPSRELNGHSDKVTGCAFSPDGSRVVSSSTDGYLMIWDARKGKLLQLSEKPLFLWHALILQTARASCPCHTIARSGSTMQ